MTSRPGLSWSTDIPDDLADVLTNFTTELINSGRNQQDYKRKLKRIPGKKWKSNPLYHFVKTPFKGVTLLEDPKSGVYFLENVNLEFYSDAKNLKIYPRNTLFDA